jgi:hypothetical protein
MKHPHATWRYIIATAALAGVACAGFSVGLALIFQLSAWIAGPVTGVVAALFVGHAIYKWGPGDAELRRAEPPPSG